MRSKRPYIWMPDTTPKVALQHSTGQSRRHFLQPLLERGADVNFNPKNDSALELAVKYADEEAVKLLLDANTDSYSPDYLLYLAIHNRDFNLVPLFVRLGANIEEPWEGVLPIVWALRHANLPNVRSLSEMADTRMDLSSQQHREAILSALAQYDGRGVFPLVFQSRACINCKSGETNDLTRTMTLYPKYECELHGVGFPDQYPIFPSHEAEADHQLSLFETLLNAGADSSASFDFGFGSSLAAAAFHGRLHHCRALLDQEEGYCRQEQQGLFRNALFAVMGEHLSFVSLEPADNWWKWKPLGNEILCPKHLEVLQLLLERGMEVYMPVYESLHSLIPLVRINREIYEINKPCRLYRKGYYGCFSRFWFPIMLDLQNGTSAPLPLGSQLLLWQFPGTLPHRFTTVTRLTALSRARPTYFINLSIRGNRSQFIIFSAPQKVRGPLIHRSEDGRWKRYKPENFGAMRFTQVPDTEVGAGLSNTDGDVGYGQVEANRASRYRRNIGWALLASLVGLFSCFTGLLLSTRK
ncbi:hypothetical protein DER46DRAFT_573248 [Fusarium sp. MPI-SDFR-AT-0072]|nr:hypothetical protein DER46DRAFT_573248 [Fusarium sp. MPI-SDFR-AT-0072]